MIRPEIITSVIVHAGTFHADDALAAALVLTAAGRDIPVKRYFTVPEGLPDTVIVADIGRGKYDHHQDDARCRPDGSKYAACGLLYEELQEYLFQTEDMREYFLNRYIRPIEDADNGICSNPLTSFIDDTNPDWYRQEESDCRFHDAVKLFQNLIKEVQRRERAALRSAELLTKAIAGAEERVVFLEKPIPWQEKVCQTDNLFVVYFSMREEWTVRCVPIEPDSFTVRCPLHSMEEMEGCEFCHTGRFLATFDSKVHALNAARKCARECGVNYIGDT